MQVHRVESTMRNERVVGINDGDGSGPWNFGGTSKSLINTDQNV
jgi:hypothetical protein